MLDVLLPALKAGRHRVLIFSQMTRLLDLLEVRGREGQRERKKRIESSSSRESSFLEASLWSVLLPSRRSLDASERRVSQASTQGLDGLVFAFSSSSCVRLSWCLNSRVYLSVGGLHVAISS